MDEAFSFIGILDEKKKRVTNEGNDDNNISKYLNN